MNIYDRIAALVEYGEDRGLIESGDRVWARNSLLAALGLDAYAPDGDGQAGESLETILTAILDDAAGRGLIDDTAASREELDTKLMGILTPRPSQVAQHFWRLYREEPGRATDWYYAFSRSTDYIRTYRVARDIKWRSPTPYGELDISINLSKPEKDPRDIAAAAKAKAAGYPACLLCREAEGCAGRAGYPPRENHRLIPLRLQGEDWFLQYSPYVYYNEHCIVLSARHRPMKIDGAAFRRMLDFVELFPHYVLAGNADLPIVGGSILSHDHFQGGNFRFAMARAPVETPIELPGGEGVEAGIVRWPMSVIRLRCPDKSLLARQGERVLEAWRSYSDPEAFIFAETEGERHNTVSPAARFRDGGFELDLILRNNITTAQYPMGVFHPHQELHHIKKENIGVIEAMGLAILPPRLQVELEELGRLMSCGGDLYARKSTAKHAPWAQDILTRETVNAGNVREILRRELGIAFSRVLEQAGVFKRDRAGREAFLRFAAAVK